MANTPFIRGLVPEPTPGIMPLTTVVTAETSTKMFIGSPVTIDEGVATVSLGADGKLTGAVVALRDSKGLSKCNKPASTAGYKAEVTFDPNQIYRITVSGTGVVTADIGEYFYTTADSATADTASTEGDAFSKTQLDSTESDSTHGQLQLIGFPKIYGNTEGLTGVEVKVRINPTLYAYGADGGND